MDGSRLWSTLVYVYVILLMEAESSPRNESVIVYDEEGHIRGFRTSTNASDFHIGFLVSVYEPESQGRCSYELGPAGVPFLEDFLFSIDTINSQQDLLPNITLGYDIRDFCKSEVQAVDETLDWVQYTDVFQAYSKSFNDEANSKFIGVVGTEASTSTIPVAGFLRVYSVPQVSYFATSPALSDKYLYPYFLRTLSSDAIQPLAMIDIVKTFGWEIVSTVSSDDEYGEEGIRTFHELASMHGVCIDVNIQIEFHASDRDLTESVNRLVYDSVAEVVVVFSLETQMLNLLEKIESLETTRSFTWVVSDGVISSPRVREFSDIVIGMFGIFPIAPIYPDYGEYLSMLNATNNVRNPWFSDYYDQILQYIDPSLFSDYSVIPLLVDAVYSIAHGLDNYLKENCDQPLVWNRTSQACSGQMRELTGPILHEYIKNVTFLSPTGNIVSFDSNGDGKTGYIIFNLQYDGSSVNNVNVGEWDVDSGLVFNSSLSNLQFGITPDGQILNSRQSECTSCVVGSAQVEVPTSCCTYCIPCLGNTYLNSSSPTMCTDCDQLMWGNNPLNGSTTCVPITQDYLDVDDALGIVVIMLELIGALLLIGVCIGIAIFWNNRVIKSFGREQMVLILIGLGLCFLVPCLYLIKPSPALCALQQLGLWFSITLILAAILVKLIRVTRIFISPVKGGKLHFIAPWQQVVFTLVIVSGQMMLVIISLIVVTPGGKNYWQNSTEDSNDFPLIVITCNPPHIALLILHILYVTVLVIIINGFGIFTIRFPANFNESKYIAFSTFAVGIVWLAFVPTYFATESNQQLQQATFVLALMLMAFCIIFCLIVPRLYVAIQSSDKINVSSSSKTSSTNLKVTLNEIEKPF